MTVSEKSKQVVKEETVFLGLGVSEEQARARCLGVCEYQSQEQRKFPADSHSRTCPCNLLTFLKRTLLTEISIAATFKKWKKIPLLLKWTMTVSALHAKHNFKDAVPLGVLELPFPWIISGFNPSLLYPLYHTRLLSGSTLRLQDNHSTSGVPLPSCENTHLSTFSFLKHFRLSLIKVYWVLRNKQTNKKKILQVLSVCSWWSFIS